MARTAHTTARAASTAPAGLDDDLESPPLDPEAVERAYRLHRAKRAAKAKRNRERKLAGVRFWIVLAMVLAVAILLAARTLGEIERVFGL